MTAGPIKVEITGFDRLVLTKSATIILALAATMQDHSAKREARALAEVLVDIASRGKPREDRTIEALRVQGDGR